jgi:hypothetical protein
LHITLSHPDNLTSYLNLHLVVFASGVAGCVVYGRRACRKFPDQARLWFWAVVVAVPALASFVLDDISSDHEPFFRHWHSVWHVLALVSTAYAMAFVLAVQLAQVKRSLFVFFFCFFLF